MLRALLKVKRLKGDVYAASRGPGPLSKRLARRAVHRLVHTRRAVYWLVPKSLK